MKKFSLFFLVLFFSFNFVNAQNHITDIIPESIIKETCVSGENAYSFWSKQLMSDNITSINSSIEEWEFNNSLYYLIRGEQGCNIDHWPLLVKLLPNGCWKVIKNFRDNYYDPTGMNYVISVQKGCVLENLDFFSNLNGNGARFIGYIWKKFPNNDYWKTYTQY